MTGFGVVLIAVDDYPDPPGRLPSSESAQRFAALLCAHGGTVRESVVATGEGDVIDTIRRWSRRANGPAGWILYLVGHGRGDMLHHEFVVPDDDRTGVVGVRTTRLGEFLQHDWLLRQVDASAWTLVVLDCCDSELGVTNLVNDLTAAYPKKPRRLGLWPVAPGGAARTGDFVDAFERALDTFTGNDAVIPLDEVFRRLRRDLGELESSGFLPEVAVLTPPVPVAPVIMTLDAHAELRRAVAALSPETRSHFVTKAQGSEVGEVAWHFVGRRDELAELVRWSAGGPTLKVVTGDAGSGKSALLGHLVVLADRQLVELYASSGLAPHLAAEPSPPDGAFDAVVHLTGKTLLETIDAIAKQLGVAVDVERTMAWQRGARSGFFAAELRRAGREGATLLLDALDEAQEPALTATFLRDLSKREHFRILVGTRRSLAEGPDRPADPTRRDLLDELGVADDDLLVVRPDEAAVQTYASRRLLAPGSPYAGDPAAAEALAARIAAAGQPFLFARLTTAELLARPMMRADDDALGALVGAGHRGVFAAALDRITATDPAAATMLRALAHARGRGVPRTGGVWEEATIALGGPADSSDELVERTVAVAGAYVTLDGEAGVSTYRLAHQTFVEHFHTDPTYGDGHRLIAGRLRARFGAPPQGWSAAPFYAVRYLPEHLVADADRTAPDVDGLVSLVTDGGWLTRAVHLLGVDRTIDVIGAARRTATARSADAGVPPELAASDAVVDMVERSLRRSRIALGRDPAQLPALLHARLGATADGRTAAVGWAAGVAAGVPWLRMTGGSLDWRADLDTTLGLVGKVRALAFGTLDDRPVVAIAIDDRIVLWDPRSGVTDEDGAVDLGGHRATGVALARFAGRAVVITSAAYDQVTEVWDVGTGARLATVAVDLGTTVVVGHLDGRLVLAGIGSDRRVRLLAADSLAPMAAPGWLEGCDVVGFVEDGGRLLALTVEWFAADGSPWQPSTPAFESRPAIAGRDALDGERRWRTPAVDGVDHRFDAVAAGRTAAGAVLVAAAAGADLHWLSGDAAERTTSRHGVPTRALAVGAIEGRTVVASAPDYDSTTLVELTEVGAPGNDQHLQGSSNVPWRVEPTPVPGALWTSQHERSDTFSLDRPDLWPHRQAAAGTLDGRPVVVTGSVDGVVWVWTADTAPPRVLAGPFGTLSARARQLGWEGMRVKPGLAMATAVAFGQHPSAGPIVAVACDGRVRLHAVPSGAAVACPSHDATVVDAVALGRVQGRDVLVTGSKGGQLVVWQLDPAERLAAITLDHPITRVRVDPDGRIRVTTSVDRSFALELVEPADPDD